MNNKKKILIGIATFLVLLLVIGIFLPTKFSVTRTAVIQAPPRLVFLYAGDLKRWRDWQIWHAKDPAMELTVSDPSFGLGAEQKWKSKEMGEGTVKFTMWESDKIYVYEMSVKEWGAPSTGTVSFDGDLVRGVTTISWNLKGEIPMIRPFGGYMALVMKRFIGKDFEDSLKKLAHISENTDPSNRAAWEKPVAPPPTSKGKPGQKAAAPKPKVQ